MSVEPTQRTIFSAAALSLTLTRDQIATFLPRD